jgi:hypothetical protein
MQILNNWAPVVVIIFGYAIGLYFQNRRLDDFKEGLYKYLGAEFSRIDTRITGLESVFDTKLKRLEDKIDHLERPVVRP